MLSNSSILITGGTGSFGHTFVPMTLAKFNPRRLVIYSRDEMTLIISTGMATVAELDETVRAAREAGCKDLILLKCTSTYPATAENTNILTIPHLRELFGCEVGLSDHTMGIGVSVTSVALGATVIEKHFTLSRADGGGDSTFSMEPAEITQLVVETERAWQALGQVRYGSTEAEKNHFSIAAHCMWSKISKSVIC